MCGIKYLQLASAVSRINGMSELLQSVFVGPQNPNHRRLEIYIQTYQQLRYGLQDNPIKSNPTPGN